MVLVELHKGGRYFSCLCALVLTRLYLATTYFDSGAKTSEAWLPEVVQPILVLLSHIINAVTKLYAGKMLIRMTF